MAFGTIAGQLGPGMVIKDGDVHMVCTRSPALKFGSSEYSYGVVSPQLAGVDMGYVEVH